MKKLLALCILIASYQSLVAQQHSIQKASAHYLRVNPLDRPFNVFLTQVMNDTDFVTDQKRLRTDTSLFYLRGHYKKFNPFHFEREIVQLVIYEQEVLYDSATHWKDTLLVCMISGVPKGNDANSMKASVNEFNFCNRKYRHDYAERKSSQLHEEGKLAGEVDDYFVGSPVLVPVFSNFWGQVLEKNEHAVGVIFRFKVYENRCDLPIPADFR